MATISGNDGVVKVGTTAIAKVTAFTLNMSANMERDDGMGEAWQSSKAGKKRWTGTINFRYDEADGGQDLVEVGDEGTGNFYPAGDAAGKKYWTGDFTVSEVSHNQDQDDRVSWSVTVEGRGALTEATVSA